MVAMKPHRQRDFTGSLTPALPKHINQGELLPPESARISAKDEAATTKLKAGKRAYT
jgi:hypothetical protein